MEDKTSTFSTALLNDDGDSSSSPDLREKIGARVKYILDNRYGGDFGLFASEADVSSSALRSYINSVSEPSLKLAKQIARLSGANLLWLAAGEGPIWNESESFNVLTLGEVAADIDHQYSNVKAGPPAQIDHLSLPAGTLKGLGSHIETTYAAGYRGFGMAPTIPNNSILLINSQSKSVSAGVYLFARPANEGSDEFIFDVRRMVREVSGDVIISADNERYSSERLTNEQFEEKVQVLGRVVSIISRYDV